MCFADQTIPFFSFSSKFHLKIGLRFPPFLMTSEKKAFNLLSEEELLRKQMYRLVNSLRGQEFWVLNKENNKVLAHQLNTCIACLCVWGHGFQPICPQSHKTSLAIYIKQVIFALTVKTIHVLISNVFVK